MKKQFKSYVTTTIETQSKLARQDAMRIMESLMETGTKFTSNQMDLVIAIAFENIAGDLRSRSLINEIDYEINKKVKLV